MSRAELSDCGCVSLSVREPACQTNYHRSPKMHFPSSSLIYYDDSDDHWIRMMMTETNGDWRWWWREKVWGEVHYCGDSLISRTGLQWPNLLISITSSSPPSSQPEIYKTRTQVLERERDGTRNSNFYNQFNHFGIITLVWSGLVWSGLVWLVRSGPVRSGPVWSGLVWSLVGFCPAGFGSIQSVPVRSNLV